PVTHSRSVSKPTPSSSARPSADIPPSYPSLDSPSTSPITSPCHAIPSASSTPSCAAGDHSAADAPHHPANASPQRSSRHWQRLPAEPPVDRSERSVTPTP